MTSTSLEKYTVKLPYNDASCHQYIDDLHPFQSFGRNMRGGRITENEVIVDPKKEELVSLLNAGKNYLRNQNPERAFKKFKTALDLARSVQDPIEEKKAARGLGASLQRQGKYRDAIKYHSMVLAISERLGEESGNTEAYGAIADCYAELGDLERAGKFYDKCISSLEKD